MAESRFDPARALGSNILSLERKEQCALASALCGRICEETGTRAFRGGIYPENISVDENGVPALGPAAESGWQGQELQFLAPELYWNGRAGAYSDVYSMGLLLYYAVSGRLPYEGECADAQLRRMDGNNFPAPRGAGRRLGEIIEKATRFKAEERYQNLEQMKIMLDSCINNLYLGGSTSAETLFNKGDDELNEIERIMVGIIERGSEGEQPEQTAEPEPPARQFDLPVWAVSAPQPEPPAPIPEKLPEKDTVTEPEPPSGSEKIPVLTEEKNPELEPVAVKPAVQYGRSTGKEKERRHPGRAVIVVAVLCMLLIIGALIANALLKDFVWANEPTTTIPAADATPDAQTGSVSVGIVAPTAETPEADPAETPAQPNRYRVFREDLSWTEAQNRCAELGGHLVVINDEEEFMTVSSLAELADISCLWIGCRRVDGELVWENGDTVTFYRWDEGEPSGYDSYDDVSEDYVMLWNNGSWVYNDSRNDPLADYYDFYAGRIGFICEYDY